MTVLLEEPGFRADKLAAEYSFTWFQRGLAIGISSIRENREGDTIALLEPFLLVGTEPKALGAPAKINLSSPIGKSQAAKALDARRHMESEGPDGAAMLTWADAIEKVSAVIQADIRKGDPIIDLSMVEVGDELPYLLKPFLPLNEVTLLLGDQSSAKSMTAMLFGLAIRHGIPVPNSDEPTIKGNVLYLDYETHDISQARRLGRVSRGAGFDRTPEGFYYRRCFRPIVDEAPRLAVDVQRLGIVLVVVDSLIWAVGDDPNDQSSAVKCMSAIRSLGCTALAICHYGKAEREVKGKRSVLGASSFEFAARSQWEVRADNFTVPDHMRQALYHRKSSDDRLLPYPLGQVLHFMDEPGRPVRFYAEEVDADDELSAGASLPARIKSLLNEQAKALTVLQIAEALGADGAVVRTTLNRLSGTAVVEVDALPTEKGRPEKRWGLMVRDDVRAGDVQRRDDRGGFDRSASRVVVPPPEPIDCAACQRLMPLSKYGPRGEPICISCAEMGVEEAPVRASEPAAPEIGELPDE